MAKRKKNTENESPEEEVKPTVEKVRSSNILKMKPSEWAMQEKKNAKFYLYYDEKLGLVSKEEFDKIEV